MRRELVFLGVVGFLILCALLSVSLWQLLFGSWAITAALTAIIVLLLIAIIWQCAKNDIFFTIVNEARARIILRSGEYCETVWMFRDHVELANGFILDRKHLFPPEAALPKSDGLVKSARDLSLVQLKQFGKIAIGNDVAYKVNMTRKRPKTRITALVTVKTKDDSEKKVETVFDLKNVYLDRNHNFMAQHEDKDVTLYDISKKVADGTYPKDFFDRTDRGFYAPINPKLYPDCSSPDRINFSTEEVLTKVIEHDWRSSKIVNKDFGNRRLFGGIHWIGFPGVYTLFRYHQNWVSMKPDGTTEVRDTKKEGVMLIDILLSDDIYVVPIKDAEDKNLVPLDITLLEKMCIVCPRLAMFVSQKVLENTSSLTGAIYRQMISGYEFEQIIREKTQLGPTWWSTFELEMCNPLTEHFFDRNGMWVKSTEVWSVEVAEKSGAKAELAKTQVKVWTAEKGRQAAIIDAEGQARALEIVAKGKATSVQIFYEQIAKFGDQGLQILFLQTLEKLGGDSGKMIIPFGGIKEFIQSSTGTAGDPKMQALLAEVAKAGITPAMIASAMQDLISKKDEVK